METTVTGYIIYIYIAGMAGYVVFQCILGIRTRDAVGMFFEI